MLKRGCRFILVQRRANRRCLSGDKGRYRTKAVIDRSTEKRKNRQELLEHVIHAEEKFNRVDIVIVHTVEVLGRDGAGVVGALADARAGTDTDCGQDKNRPKE